MKRVYLRAAALPEVPRLTVLKQDGPLIQAETDLFPRQLRQALDKAGARGAEILLYAHSVISMPGVRTPHPSVLEDERLQRALLALEPDLIKWLRRFLR
jgi:hypothetical protein